MTRGGKAIKTMSSIKLGESVLLAMRQGVPKNMQYVWASLFGSINNIVVKDTQYIIAL